MSEWKDKVAIITGASSGIGVGIALEFAKLGCAIVLTGRDANNLTATANECKKLGLAEQKILCIKADMLIDDEVKSIVSKTIKKFGKINVLVNNAGMLKMGGIPNINMMEYNDIMQVNLRSVVLLTQEAVPHLIKIQGNVVNISSIITQRGWPNFTAYAMSKAALDHFTRCGAADLAKHKVRVNAVLPGMIDTAIFERLGLGDENRKKMLEVSTALHPMGRLGTPKDIGLASVFFASDSASYITGQVIVVDGSFPGTFEY